MWRDDVKVMVSAMDRLAGAVGKRSATLNGVFTSLGEILEIAAYDLLQDNADGISVAEGVITDTKNLMEGATEWLDEEEDAENTEAMRNCAPTVDDMIKGFAEGEVCDED